MSHRIVHSLVRLPQRFDRAPHIGVIANTHGYVPASALERLRDVDLIFHAGDIGEASVLTRLQAIAPVIVVAGDHDRRSRHPEFRLLQIGGKTIALTHGHRLPHFGNPLRGLLSYSRSGDDDQLLLDLLSLFPPVDCLVFGHPTTACRVRIVDSLLFNPGVIAQAGEGVSMSASVGILTLGRHIDGSIIQIGPPPTTSAVLLPA